MAMRDLQEVELWDGNTERARWQSLGDLYVAIKVCWALVAF